MSDPMRVPRRSIASNYSYRLRMDDDDQELLRQLVEAEKLPLSEILRRALRSYARKVLRSAAPAPATPGQGAHGAHPHDQT